MRKLNHDIKEIFSVTAIFKANRRIAKPREIGDWARSREMAREVARRSSICFIWFKPNLKESKAFVQGYTIKQVMILISKCRGKEKFKLRLRNVSIRQRLRSRNDG